MALDPISSIVGLADTVIKRVWKDPAQQAEQLFKLTELQQKGDIEELRLFMQELNGQLEINKMEASHDSIFVAGWRPFIGWVCGSALAYNFVVSPILDIWLEVPKMDMTQLMPVLLGMLGLGGMRTFEKLKGVTRNGKK